MLEVWHRIIQGSSPCRPARANFDEIRTVHRSKLILRGFFILLVVSTALTTARAEPLKPLPADSAAVAACLKLAGENGEKEAQRKEPISETPGAAGRLAEAARLAPLELESCIGAVAHPCQQRPDGNTTAGMIECYGREWAVWDERLNRFYKGALKDAAPKLAAAMRATQRAWLQWREQKCKLPAVENEGGSIVGPLYNSCMMEMTARQAIWLQQK